MIQETIKTRKQRSLGQIFGIPHRCVHTINPRVETAGKNFLDCADYRAYQSKIEPEIVQRYNGTIL